MGELRSASVTLAEIIAYIKQTRQTGRLLVRPEVTDAPAGVPAILTFDNGHLIDARWGDETGDDLVYRLLANRGATYAFDRLTPDKLPTERNILRYQELLVLAAIGILSEEDAGQPDPARAPALAAATRPSEAPPHPSTNGATTGHSLPAQPAPPAAAAGPPPDPGSAPGPAVPPPQDPPPAVAVAAPPPPRSTGRPLRSFRRRNMIPLPLGTPSYTVDTPPGDFVAFLDSLEQEQLSGYVTWFSEGAEGLLLLYGGQVIDAFWAEIQSPATYGQQHAVRRFAAASAVEGAQHIAVHILDPDFVHSYSSLAYGANRPQEQALEKVQLPVLLARLAGRRHTGCVKVVAAHQAAYLFLAHGQVLGEYRALPDALEEAPGWAEQLVRRAGSLVDIYTAPPPSELLALNAAAWPASRVVAELRHTIQEVLGPKAGPVLSALAKAGTDPRALHAAALRAKQVTRVFIGPEKYAELSGRIDRLLAHLQ